MPEFVECSKLEECLRSYFANCLSINVNFLTIIGLEIIIIAGKKEKDLRFEIKPLVPLAMSLEVMRVCDRERYQKVCQ